MEIDLKTLFIEFLFISFCFVGVIIATKKTHKKLQDKPPKELSEKPDPIIEDLKQYALKTQDLFLKEHVLDPLTVCIRKANDSEEDLVSLLKNKPEDMTTENLTYRFLLNFEKNRSRNLFFETLKSDTTKANLIREYDKLITAYEGIFPVTKELEEIHEKKIELLDLNSQLYEAFMKGREEASNWLKSHSGFLKEFKKNYRELKKLYVIKQIDLNKLWIYDQSEKEIMIANFIWNEIFGKGWKCPGDLVHY